MKRWLLFALYLAFILAVIIGADLGRLGFLVGAVHRVPGFDKIAHALLVGFLAFLLNYSLRGRRLVAAGRHWLLGSLLVGVAITLEECSQAWIPGRTFDLGDLAANWTGIAVAGWWFRTAGNAAEKTQPLSESSESGCEPGETSSAAR